MDLSFINVNLTWLDIKYYFKSITSQMFLLEQNPQIQNHYELLNPYPIIYTNNRSSNPLIPQHCGSDAQLFINLMWLQGLSIKRETSTKISTAWCSDETKWKRQRNANNDQCLKCLTLVKTSDTPYLLQQSMASVSLMLQPCSAITLTPF